MILNYCGELKFQLASLRQYVDFCRGEDDHGMDKLRIPEAVYMNTVMCDSFPLNDITINNSIIIFYYSRGYSCGIILL